MPKNSAMDKLRRKQEVVRDTRPKLRPGFEEELRDSRIEDAETFEEDLEVSFAVQKRQKLRNDRKQRRISKCIEVLLVACCVYLAFLIYGLINTEFVYDNDGNIVPLGLTVQQIKDQGNFNRLALQYRQGRMLYEQVLLLDYRVAAGIEDPLLIAPEYEVLLSSVESLSIQLSAMEVQAEYVQTKNMLLAWTQNDIAIYAQCMSRAISQNNTEYANQALEYRGVMYNDFSIITQNLVTLGSQIDGVELKDIVEWSPENYVQETLGVYYN